MNAAQAKYAATDYNEKHNSAEYQSIIDQIKTKAHKGLFSVEVKSISATTKKKLQSEGFNIVDCSDPRDGYSEWSIRWD